MIPLAHWWMDAIRIGILGGAWAALALALSTATTDSVIRNKTSLWFFCLALVLVIASFFIAIFDPAFFD